MIILLISAAVLAVGWNNRKIIAGWGNQNTEDAAEKEDLILEIDSVEDYLTFVRSVNKGNTYKGQYVNLNADLDLAEVEEDLVIGNAENTQYCFQGIFDGNGHHLSNVMITSDTDAGLFRNLEGTVANLQVESGDFSGTAGRSHCIQYKTGFLHFELWKSGNCERTAGTGAGREDPADRGESR